MGLASSGRLDNLKDELVKRDLWREMMGYITRGPFEKPAASVQIQVLSRDLETGQATLRIRPVNGDTVYMETKGPATISSKKLEEYDLKTKALKLSFLCVDSKGERHRGGGILDQRHRRETPLLPGGIETQMRAQGPARRAIRFTTDGSGVETSGVPYAKPFEIPADCRVILAVAEGEGIKSPSVNIPAPQGKVDPAATIDRAKAAVWKHAFKKDSTGETYQFLEALYEEAQRRSWRRTYDHRQRRPLDRTEHPRRCLPCRGSL